MYHPELAVITYGALEMDAAAALIKLRYQFEDHEAENMVPVCSANNVVRCTKPSQLVVLKRSKEHAMCTRPAPYKPHKRSLLRHLQSIPDAAQIYCADPEQCKEVYDFLDKQEMI